MPVTSFITADKARAQSVKGPQNGDNLLMLGYDGLVGFERKPLLPAWGTQVREVALRNLYRHQHNSLVVGVLAGIVNRVISTPYQISAPNEFKAEAGHALLREAEFGKGYEWWLSEVILNFLRHDRGVWIEKIGYGNPANKLVGVPLAVSYLDPLRCYPTGDAEFPIVYLSTDGKWHKMHESRIEHLLDMPDGDDSNPELGLCALSRAVAIAERQMLGSEYAIGNLDDEPPPGLMVMSNISKERLEMATSEYRDSVDRLEKPVFGRTLLLFGTNPELPLHVESIPWSKAPEKYDFVAYTQLDAKLIAAAVGVDILDFWELSGQGIGTATQSQVLSEKGKGKILGRIYKGIERMMNLALLPVDCEFSFEYKDPQQDAAIAAVDSSYVGMVTSLRSSGTISALEARQMLANTVEAFRDVLLDADGQVRLPDDDESEEKPDASTLPDEEQDAAHDTDEKPASGQYSQLPEQTTKAFTDTASEFSDNFSDLVSLYQSGSITRRSLTTRFRAQLKRLGTLAFADGLEQGGVPREELTTEEKAQVLNWLGEQSSYIAHFVDEITDRPLPDATIGVRAGMWVRKSLREVNQLGVLAAAGNKMYEWVYGDTEHCETCKALNGHRHRYRTFARANLLPGSSQLECGGFHCQCELKPTSERASGRLYRIPRKVA